MFNLRRTATYVLITTLAALALLYPMLTPDKYAASHVATAPARIKTAFVLLTALGLLIPFTLTRVLFARLETLIEQQHTAIHNLLKVQRLEVASADRVRQTLHTLNHAAQTAAALLLWSLFATRILNLFPDAQPAARELRLIVVGPLVVIGKAVIDYLPNAVQIVIILVIARYTLKVIHLFFHALDAEIIVLPDFYPEWAEPTYKIVRLLVFVFIPFLIVPLLPGANSQFFDKITFFIGLLVSLGSTSAIKNMTAGIVLTYTRAFQIGDHVRIGDVSGDVSEKSLFVTRVKTIKNEQIAMPNGAVLDSNIVNFSALAAEKGLILHTSVTIGYDVHWRQVQELLIDSALATPHILHDPMPFVLQTSLDDYYVAHEINAYTDQPNQIAGTLSVLHQHILDTFHAAGVEIMSPSYSALRDGSDIAIPQETQRSQVGGSQAAPLPVGVRWTSSGSRSGSGITKRSTRPRIRKATPA
jgi:small-conductance mechanosensitive channel